MHMDLISLKLYHSYDNKIIVNIHWSQVVETNATFRPASTGLDHAWVTCSFQQLCTKSQFTIYYHFDSWSH